ncbi:putative zinc finger protein 286B [Neocloeon triangulifer]|uniref:putative zinc finger protein 286B n=1 Tax=Neocloeon triangulifer TaxID=2078957 RepID=UPI00286F83AC|nr:putative zinc finger protein 286B [Neocloeon triangulifer]
MQSEKKEGNPTGIKSSAEVRSEDDPSENGIELIESRNEEFIQQDSPENKSLDEFEFVSFPSSPKANYESEDFDPLMEKESETIVDEEPVVIEEKCIKTATVVQPIRTVQIQPGTLGGTFFQVIQTTPGGNHPRLILQSSAGSSVLPKIVPKRPQLIKSREPEESGRYKKAQPRNCLHCDTPQAFLEQHLENEECYKAIVKCSNCHRIFTSEKNYFSHFSLCSLQSMTCEFCEKVFTSGYLFAYHWYHEHTDEIPRDVNDCDLCHNNWCQLLVGMGKPKCMICSSYYSSRVSLLVHVHASHLKASFQIQRIMKKRLTCNLCFNNFDCAKELVRHYLRLQCKFRRCTFCKAVLKDKDTHTKHVDNCHNFQRDQTILVPGEHHQCMRCSD